MGLPALFAGCACSMRFCDIKRLCLCISQGLVFGDESLLVDDTCTNSEEGDCSLSLRQLRLHKAQERAESVHSEPQSIEPVSFVLPCTEPSELEGVQLSEIKAEEEKEEKEQEEMAEFAKYRGDDCFQLRVYWREKNNAITMPGTHRTRQSSPQHCQELCAKMTGCGHFSYWSDGGCLLTSGGAHPVNYHGGVLSGGPSCGSTADTYKEPAYKGPSVMKVGPRGGMDPPTHVQQYNGVAWPTMKITDDKDLGRPALGILQNPSEPFRILQQLWASSSRAAIQHGFNNMRFLDVASCLKPYRSERLVSGTGSGWFGIRSTTFMLLATGAPW